MKLDYYKYKDGILIRNKDKYPILDNRVYKLNDDNIFKDTHTTEWKLIENIVINSKDDLKLYKTKQHFKAVWKVKNDKIISDDFPAEFEATSETECVDDFDESYDVWKLIGDRSDLNGLYNRVSVACDDTLEQIEITELNCLGEINYDLNSLTTPCYTLTSIANTPIVCTLNKGIVYDEIITILEPDIKHGDFNCKLSSFSMYNIVQYYIRENINNSAAFISSDYNFCFEVKHLRTWNKCSNIRKDAVSCFEMTSDASKYKDYTVIPSLHGKNADDLKAKLDRYLLDLITKINTPIKLCECCNGDGFVQ